METASRAPEDRVTVAPVPTSLAERKRDLVRAELSEAALYLLADRGFEATTVDEIVTRAGVSRRTFFRYFASKEDVVVEFLGDLGAKMCDALRARPADEDAAQALCEALVAVVAAAHREHPAKTPRLTRLIVGTPALRARQLARQDQWRRDLAAVLLERRADHPPGRVPSREDGLQAELLAGTALVAFDVAMVRWAEDVDTVPGDLLREVFAALPGAAPQQAGSGASPH